MTPKKWCSESGSIDNPLRYGFTSFTCVHRMVISGSLSTILFAALRNALVTNNGYYRIDNILEYFYNELQFEKLNVRIRSKI